MIRWMTLLIALSGLVPAGAHHLPWEKGAYLVFWKGSGAPPDAVFAGGSCPEGRFWEQGFVSIYPQGGFHIP